ncbi:Uncharacterised protein [Campylobacter jejuni subsp. doylei]|uniref:Restriction endonuclease n=1 Tax=Campylobacter jejuni subsp. doylei TaxID=32021 RepID=A0A3S4S4D2_CAMJU|nr:restriction endonuclease [Campylobacter jejuni]VEG61987.1 Uncharacterised protein [Campylobacter jejuni subsp. doylei]
MENAIKEFLNKNDYDIRKSHSARWIDQKCTCDVLCIIADCILEYVNSDINTNFSISDIWNNQYTKENVESLFSKPDLNSKSSKNEYDKFFSQPINLLVYSGVIKFIEKESNMKIFSIQNLSLLEYISIRDTNSLLFLQLYIEKVLKDSNLYVYFNDFLSFQNKASFKKLKEKFIDFVIKNTPINTATECSRIFTKILNPLAFKYRKNGVRRGVMSNTIITFDELKYNRLNFRDVFSGKEKSDTRTEHNKKYIQLNIKYNIQKAKRIVSKYNEKYNNGLSEILNSEDKTKATQIHHIFPASDFPIISDYIENLIALTPNQHFLQAHPKNNTRYISRDFQYICLVSKMDMIIKDTTHTYSFNNYRYVLNIGLNTKDFASIEDCDLLIEKLDCYYSDCKVN